MPSNISSHLLSQLIEAATDGVLIMESNSIIRFVNPAMATLSGYSADDLVGRSLISLLPEAMHTEHDRFVEGYVRGTRAATVLNRTRELELRHRDGELIPVELKAVDLGSEKGSRYFGAIIVDARARKNAESQNAALMTQLEQQALTDELTGLPNRRAFEREATRLCALAMREQWPLTVGIADLDRFKNINDQFGHAVGDIVLKYSAQSFSSALRAGDLIGRWGGEEFGLILPHTTPKQAVHIAERMRHELESAFIESGTLKLQITASFGVAELKPGDSYIDALKHADKSLYEAKLGGRNRVICRHRE